MTQVRQIIKFALKQLGVIDAGEEPESSEAADALYLLNQMAHDWKNDSVDLLWTDVALNDTLSFWVPPKSVDGQAIDAVAYQGTWDAAANSPALASSVGTNGHVYKVSTSGTTNLNDTATWTAGEYLIFDGWSQTWIKGRTSRQFEDAITALLTVRLAPLFGVPVSQVMGTAANSAWLKLQATYVVAPLVTVDDALRRMNSNRYINGNLL